MNLETDQQFSTVGEAVAADVAGPGPGDGPGEGPSSGPCDGVAVSAAGEPARPEGAGEGFEDGAAVSAVGEPVVVDGAGFGLAEGPGGGSEVNTSRVAGSVAVTTGSVSFLGVPVTVTLVSGSSWIK